MSESSVSASGMDSLVKLPEHPIGYLLILLAVITGLIHLTLAMAVINFSQTMGILFGLNGLGYLGGIAVYVSRFWRKEFYIVAALYALATIGAFFYFQGFGIDAFYSQGTLNTMAVVAKLVEAFIVIDAAYLFNESSS